ncbi:MAG: hypothetical protein HQ488_02485 [Parcubacteria group bacterium]|nr:hypothetical protein [Parcubacteria group bacterium]
MENITVYLNRAEVNKFTFKYVLWILFFILLGVLAVGWFLLRWSFGVFGVQDLVLIAMPFVTVFASYGSVKMILDMRRSLEKGDPVITLTSDYIELESQRIPISSITKILTQQKVTFIYATNVKRFVRILPYMRGKYGMEIDNELASLWEEKKKS